MKSLSLGCLFTQHDPSTRRGVHFFTPLGHALPPLTPPKPVMGDSLGIVVCEIGKVDCSSLLHLEGIFSVLTIFFVRLRPSFFQLARSYNSPKQRFDFEDSPPPPNSF